MMTGIGFLGLVFMVIFWVGLIAMAVWFVKAVFQGERSTPSGPSTNLTNAREILNQRYARGEITREQYETIKQDLQ